MQIDNGIANGQWATQQCNVLCSLLAATSQFSVLIGQRNQLINWDNGNDMRNATCADIHNAFEWHYCPPTGGTEETLQLFHVIVSDHVSLFTVVWMTLAALFCQCLQLTDFPVEV